MAATGEQLHFGPFLADTVKNQLRRGDAELDLRPQAFQVLKALIQNAGRYLDYQEMIRAAWDGTVVSKHTVAVTVGEVKKAMQEYGSWISYRPKLGYKLEVPKSDDLIRKGWHFWEHHTREGFEKAICCFEKAAAQGDADFRAYEGASSAYLMLATYGMKRPREMYARFLDLHQRAVASRGLTPELRADRAHGLHVFERRIAEAETELLRAEQERARSVPVQVRLSLLYATTCRPEQALRALERTHENDVLHPTLASTRIVVHIWNRDFKAALQCGEQAIELHPYHQLCRFFNAMALECSGQIERALAEYRLTRTVAPDFFWVRTFEAACLLRLGQEREARGLLNELNRLREAEYLDPYHFATMYAAWGKVGEAMQELEQAYEENSCMLHVLDVDPKLDPLRNDPLFARLRRKVFAHSEELNAQAS
jgi:DNA-binding winged helix-turn-helix (wHTH) protein